MTMATDLKRVWQDTQACTTCDHEKSRTWYARKHRFIKRHKRDDLSMSQACAIYAVLSTNATVNENDRNYRKVMAGEPVGHFGDVLRRVDLALADDVDGALSYRKGRKITSFAHNLRWPSSWDGPSTLDRHMFRMVVADGSDRLAKNLLATRDGYDQLGLALSVLADRVGLRRHELQAALWCHWVYCGE